MLSLLLTNSLEREFNPASIHIFLHAGIVKHHAIIAASLIIDHTPCSGSEARRSLLLPLHNITLLELLVIMSVLSNRPQVLQTGSAQCIFGTPNLVHDARQLLQPFRLFPNSLCGRVTRNNP